MASNIYVGITITVSDSPLILLCFFFDSHYIKIRSAAKNVSDFYIEKPAAPKESVGFFAFFVVE